jgi:NADH-ubiquinone oxidoreductase chain 5
MFVINIKLINNNNFIADLEFIFRVWSLLFLFLVLLISLRVIIFSFSYISGVKVNIFIFLYLSFVIRILWLVVNNNFYWIMFGWDGLGVVSFLLIVFYMNYERVNNGLFTIFQNRIGDLFFVLFIVGLGTLSISFNLVLIWGLFFLISGRIVKRAQFPFNAWLLSAIRAPTPISSLVHSSTLVVAGVYILLQFSYCLIDILEYLKLFSILSLIISFYGLINERDIKKLIAYSTIRHVSLIIYLLSYKLFKVVYFHLNIHAIFKSLIFMCFGFLMLSSFHAQDKRLTSLISLNPIIKITYYFACFSLAGLPFLRGFFSKDLIIEKIIRRVRDFFSILLLLLFLRVSIYYSLKLILLNKIIFSQIILEINILSWVRVLMIILLRILVINLYLSLVFRISLEVFSYKVRIYFLILIFFLLSLMSNLNYKFIIYNKNINFKETLFLNVYFLDQYVYNIMFYYMHLINNLSFLKLLLLANWWLLFIFIVVY